MRKLLITAFIIFLITNNPKALLTDYRDIFIGSYFCTKQCQTLNANLNIAFFEDTLSINITKDNLDSVLNINIKQNNYKVKLLNGILIPYRPGDLIHGYFYSLDSISFAISLSHTPNICMYKGIKF